MERYMLQLACFAKNTRVENQLVITGPGPSGKTLMLLIGRLMNTNATCVNGKRICKEGTIQGTPGMFYYYQYEYDGRVNVRLYNQRPFVIEDTDSVEEINKCLERTKYKLTKEFEFRPYYQGIFYSFQHIRSQMMMIVDIEDFSSKDCDIVRTENIKCDNLDRDLQYKLESEIDAIKSLCMQVYEKNKDKIITK